MTKHKQTTASLLGQPIEGWMQKGSICLYIH